MSSNYYDNQQPRDYNALAAQIEQEEGLPDGLLRAVVGQESSGNKYAKSNKGAMGLGQLMPDTAKRFGVTDPYDPEQNLRGSAKYLKFLHNKYNGDLDLTLAGYNAGEGNVDKYGGIPPFKETQNYVPAVKNKLARITGNQAYRTQNVSQKAITQFDDPIEFLKQRGYNVDNNGFQGETQQTTGQDDIGQFDDPFEYLKKKGYNVLPAPQQPRVDNGVRIFPNAGFPNPTRSDQLAQQFGMSAPEVKAFKDKFGYEPFGNYQGTDASPDVLQKTDPSRYSQLSNYLEYLRNLPTKGHLTQEQATTAQAVYPVEKAFQAKTAPNQRLVGATAGSFANVFTGDELNRIQKPFTGTDIPDPGTVRMKTVMVDGKPVQVPSDEANPTGNPLLDVLSPENIAGTLGGVGQLLTLEGVATGVGGKLASQAGRLGEVGKVLQGGQELSNLQKAGRTAAIFGTQGALQNPDPTGQNNLSLGQELSARIEQGVKSGASGFVGGYLSQLGATKAKELLNLDLHLIPEAAGFSLSGGARVALQGYLAGKPYDEIEKDVLHEALVNTAYPTALGLGGKASELLGRNRPNTASQQFGDNIRAAAREVTGAIQEQEAQAAQPVEQQPQPLTPELVKQRKVQLGTELQTILNAGAKTPEQQARLQEIADEMKKLNAYSVVAASQRQPIEPPLAKPAEPVIPVANLTSDQISSEIADLQQKLPTIPDGKVEKAEGRKRLAALQKELKQRQAGNEQPTPTTPPEAVRREDLDAQINELTKRFEDEAAISSKLADGAELEASNERLKAIAEDIDRLEQQRKALPEPKIVEPPKPVAQPPEAARKLLDDPNFDQFGNTRSHGETQRAQLERLATGNKLSPEVTKQVLDTHRQFNTDPISGFEIAENIQPTLDAAKRNNKEASYAKVEAINIAGANNAYANPLAANDVIGKYADILKEETAALNKTGGKVNLFRGKGPQFEIIASGVSQELLNHTLERAKARIEKEVISQHGLDKLSSPKLKEAFKKQATEPDEYAKTLGKSGGGIQYSVEPIDRRTSSQIRESAAKNLENSYVDRAKSIDPANFVEGFKPERPKRQREPEYLTRRIADLQEGQRFATPEELLQQEYNEIAKKLSPKQREALKPAFDKLLLRDELLKDLGDNKEFQFLGASEREYTARRAIEFTDQTGVPSFYTEFDFRNVGGLNELGRDVADGMLKEFGHLIAKNLQSKYLDSAKVSLFRHGGDEVSAIIVGADKPTIDTAIAKATLEVDKLVKQRKLESLPHPKGSLPGTGIVAGVAQFDAFNKNEPMTMQQRVEETLGEAGRQVEEKKDILKKKYQTSLEKENTKPTEAKANERKQPKETRSDRTSAPGGNAGTTASTSGTGKATRGKVSKSESQQRTVPQGQPGNSDQAKEVANADSSGQQAGEGSGTSAGATTEPTEASRSANGQRNVDAEPVTPSTSSEPAQAKDTAPASQEAEAVSKPPKDEEPPDESGGGTPPSEPPPTPPTKPNIPPVASEAGREGETDKATPSATSQAATEQQSVDQAKSEEIEQVNSTEPTKNAESVGEAEEPAKPTETEPVSAEKAPETGKVEEASKAPDVDINKPVSLAEHKQITDRIKDGKISAEEYKQQYKRLVQHETSIKAELAKLTKDDLFRKIGYKDNSLKKDRLVNTVYTNMLHQYLLGNSYTMSMYEKPSNAIGKVVDGVTDEALQNYSVARKEKLASLKKALTNPETLEEYKEFVMARGLGALSPEQRAKYEDLTTLNKQEAKEKQLERSAVVKKVDIGDTKLDIVEHFHTKRNKPVFVVTMSDRVPTETYQDLNSKAKKLGGYYSKSYQNSPAGFSFDSREQAQKFVDLQKGDVSNLDAVQERKAEVEGNARARLKDIADRLEASAKQSLERERKTNTARRSRMASGAEAVASRDLALSRTMNNVVEAMENGDIQFLGKLAAKTQFETLEHILNRAKFAQAQKEGFKLQSYDSVQHKEPSIEDIDSADYPYPSVYSDSLQRLVDKLKTIDGQRFLAARLGKRIISKDNSIKFNDTGGINDLREALKHASPEGRYDVISDSLAEYDRLQAIGLDNLTALKSGLREYLKYRDTGTTKINPIRQMERNLIGKDIPGYFPSPSPVVDEVLAKADIQPGMKVLEPSAGKGSIADAVRAKTPTADLSTIEINPALRDVLKAKGHNLVDSDFLSHQGQYDRIVMNPPFENGQYAEHIKHAYDLLAPGGRLVSVIPGSFTSLGAREALLKAGRSYARDFGKFLEDTNGEVEPLPEGSFKASDNSTGVSTSIVTIDKPKAATQPKVEKETTVTPQPATSHPVLDKLLANMKDGKANTFLPNGEQRSLGEWLRKEAEAGNPNIQQIERPNSRSGNEYIINTPQGKVRVGATGIDTFARLEGEPAPAEPSKPETPKPIATGKTGTVITADGTKADFQYEVADINDLNTSHNNLLDVNSTFPKELQPKDRERAASQLQVSDIEQKLEPGWLTNNPLASHGAPIVGDDYNVESGNARTIAVRRAYEANSQKAQEYKQYLIDNAKDFGLDPEQIKNAKAPILVRKRTSDVDRIRFVREANKETLSRMSPFEQAKSDAALLTPRMLDKFAPTEDGDILTAANRQDFIPDYFKNIIKSEQGGYLDSDGNINTDGIKRIKNSILMAAYGDTSAGNKVLENIIESPDNNIKNIANGLLKSAGKLLDLRRNKPEFNITDDLMTAVAKLSSLREKGQSVDDYLAQDSMFGKELTPFQENILKALDESKRSSGKVVKLLDSFVSEANNPERKLSKEAAFSQVSKHNDDQLSLFQDAINPDELKAPEGVTRRKLWNVIATHGLKDADGNKLSFKQAIDATDKALYLMDTFARSTGKDLDTWYRDTFANVISSKMTKPNGKINAKGATDFLKNGQAVLHLFEGADASTLVHESFHIFRRQLTPEENSILNESLAKAGFKGVDLNNFDATNKEHIGAEEYIARAGENYLRKGELPEQAPSKLKEVFNSFGGWLKSIYDRLQAKIGDKIKISFSPQVKKFFNEVQFDDQARQVFERRFINGSGESQPRETNAQKGISTTPIAGLETNGANEKPVSQVPNYSLPGSGELKSRQTIESARPNLDPELAKQVPEQQYNTLTNNETEAAARDLITRRPDEALTMAMGDKSGALENEISMQMLRQAQQKGDFAQAKSILNALAKRSTEAGRAIQILSRMSQISPDSVVGYANKLIGQEAAKVPETVRKHADAVTNGISDIINTSNDAVKVKEGIIRFFQKAILPKSLENKVVKIISSPSTKQMQLNDIAQAVAKHYKIPTLKDETAQKIYDLSKQAQTATGREKEKLDGLIKTAIGEEIPSSFGQKLADFTTQGKLLNPSTAMKYAIGHTGFPSLLELPKDVVKAGVDKATSLFTGKRTAVMPEIGSQIKNFKEGAAKRQEDIKLGIDTSKQSLPYLPAFRGKIGRAVNDVYQKVYSVLPAAIEHASYEESIRNQLKAEKLNGNNLNAPTDKMKEIAEQEAAEKALGDNSFLANIATGIKKTLNFGKPFGLGDAILKFAKVPANLVSRGVEYSGGGFVRAAYELARPQMAKMSGGKYGGEFRQRRFADTLARAIVGSAGLVAAAAVLTNKGVIIPDPKDKSASQLRDEAGAGGNRINLSGLVRLASREDAKLQPGDTTIKFDWLEPFGFMLHTGMAMANHDKSGLVKGLVSGVDETLGEEKILQSIGDAFSAKDSHGNPKSYIEKGTDMAAKLPGLLIPTLVQQARTLIDEKARTRKAEVTGNEYADKVIADVMDQVPGLSSQLPEKVGLFGDDKIRRAEGAAAIPDSFANPAKLSTYKPTPEQETALGLYDKLGKQPSQYLPSNFPSKTKINGQEKQLTPEEHNAAQRDIGGRYKQIYNAFKQSNEANKVAPDIEAKAISGRLELAKEQTKAKVLGNEPGNVKKLLAKPVVPDQDTLDHNLKVKAELDKVQADLKNNPRWAEMYNKLNPAQKQHFKSQLQALYDKGLINEDTTRPKPLQKADANVSKLMFNAIKPGFEVPNLLREAQFYREK